jgi:predicted XRE-type DNA-binding protein
MTRYEELMSMIAVETDECIVWPHSKDRYGYGKVWCNGDTLQTHRTALRSMCPPPTEDHQASHGPCHNRACVNPQHLSWKTRTENQFDKLRDGTHARGETHHLAKFSDDVVNSVRALYAMGNLSQAEVGLRFGVSRQHVAALVNHQVRIAA